MSVNGISALERGIRQTPHRETLALLVDALSLTGSDRETFESAASTRTSRSSRSKQVAAPESFPAVLTNFVGRENDIDAIVASIEMHRLVTILGPGGVGKTRTALEVASLVRGTMRDGVHLVELAPLGDGERIGSAIAHALGVPQSINRGAIEQVAAYARQRSLLLILDNCEHVIDDVAFASSRLMRECAGLKILATSREALRISGERTHRLRGLDASAAIALFTDRARAIDHTFSIDDRKAETVAALCRRLDGLPLAIELATARLNQMQPQALLTNLEQRFHVLTGGERDAPSRQRTLYAAIDWSFGLLPPSEKHIFERLSIFPDAFSHAAAGAVCSESTADDLLDSLASLADKSLVEVLLDGDEPRYRMLESTRAFAAERLAERGETIRTARKLLYYCVKVAMQIGALQDSGVDAAWRGLLQSERANFRAALKWALVEEGDIAAAQRLICLLHYAWGTFPREGRSWTRIARKHVDDSTPKDIRAGLALLESIIALQYIETSAALAAAREAAPLFREINNESGRIWAVGLATLTQVSLGELDTMNATAARNVEDARALGRPRLLSFALRVATVTYGATGNLEHARACNAEAHRLLAPYDATFHMLMISGHDRSRIEALAGNYDAAIQIVREAQAELAENAPALSALLLMDQPLWLASIGRSREAPIAVADALRFAVDAGIDILTTRCLYNYALVEIMQAEPQDVAFAEVARGVAPLFGFAERACGEAGTLPYAWHFSIIDAFESRLRFVADTQAFRERKADGERMTQRQAIALYRELAATNGFL
jgi:predicted ATPase